MSGGPLSPSRQVVFHQMLVAARRSVLNDALSEVLGQIDPDITKKTGVGINRREKVNQRVIQEKE
jgi:hypothetical protein